MRKYSLLACMMSMLFITSYSTVAADSYSPICDEWSVGSGKLKVGADWLYWQINQDNLDSASILRYDFESGLTTARPVSQNQRWNSGYRVNLGYEFCDCWDLGLSYTDIHYRTNSRHHNLTGTDEFFGLGDQFYFSDYVYPETLNGLHARWRSELNWLDLDISRAVCFGECLTIRPHIGFRALWNNRQMHIHGQFAEPVVINDVSVINPYYSAHLKDDVSGYGAEGGFWGNWELGCGLSVVGHVGGSILYTKHRTHQSSADVYYTQSVTGTTGSTGSTGPVVLEDVIVSENPFEYRHSEFFGVPTMDYFIGLQYNSTFCDFIISSKIGWEQHIFFDINRISKHRGNLSAQGLTLSFEAAF